MIYFLTVDLIFVFINYYIKQKEIKTAIKGKFIEIMETNVSTSIIL